MVEPHSHSAAAPTLTDVPSLTTVPTLPGGRAPIPPPAPPAPPLPPTAARRTGRAGVLTGALVGIGSVVVGMGALVTALGAEGFIASLAAGVAPSGDGSYVVLGLVLIVGGSAFLLAAVVVGVLLLRHPIGWPRAIIATLVAEWVVTAVLLLWAAVIALVIVLTAVLSSRADGERSALMEWLAPAVGGVLLLVGVALAAFLGRSIMRRLAHALRPHARAAAG